jgi:hypothetical protein
MRTIRNLRARGNSSFGKRRSGCENYIELDLIIRKFKLVCEENKGKNKGSCTSEMPKASAMSKFTKYRKLQTKIY